MCLSLGTENFALRLETYLFSLANDGCCLMIVGIDLGTTNSLCAVFQNGQTVLVPNAHGKFLTPSVVGVLDDGQILVGDSAKELRVTQPANCASRFKRYMGTNKKLPLGEKSFSAVELSSMVLKSLKHDAEAFLGSEVAEAVITVPAYFNDSQRRATKLAGEMAGFKVRRIINEPTAAALTYGFHDRQSEKHLLVIDLGGGTFDVTLMEIFEGSLEIVSTAGESMLGGEDFTDRLVAAVLKKVGKSFEVAELKEPLLVARLRQECERVKVAFAQEEQAQIRIPDASGSFPDNAPTVKVTRSSFAALVDPLLDRLADPIHRALRDGDCEPSKIDEVILVGGATRMQCMHEFIVNRFKLEPAMKFNPDEVVALGAAVQAALIENDQAVDDMVMTDVCPHTLGVEIAKSLGNQIRGGYFQPIIHRNTTIPCSREEYFSTVTANQYEVRLKIYQGESRKVQENHLLGELTVEGIPPGPEGTEIIVRFTYDTNGILEVEAFVPSGGKKFRTVLTQNATGLTQAEIDAAIRQMQGVKFYPREDIENQRLLRFCERLVTEIPPYHRESFELAIDQFERAMASNDRDYFEHAKSGLQQLLSAMGFNPDTQDEDNKP